MRRKLLIALGAGALSAPFASLAQQQTKVARIGFLGAETPSDTATRVEAMRSGLRDLGYVEVRNIVIEFRWAEGKYDRLRDLAAELVGLKVDVIVTDGAKAVLAAKQATTTVPIVIGNVSDPVALGLVSSLARPGGNITGSASFGPETVAKRLELLRQFMPHLRRVGALLNPGNPSSAPKLEAMQTAAKSLKVELYPAEVRASSEFDGVFASLAAKRVEAVIVDTDTLFVANGNAIAVIATKTRLPSAGSAEYAEAGGMLGYGPNLLELFRRAAYFIDRILKGARPGDLPIERASRFELVINVKTAKALGVTIPKAVLVRADRLIE
ncbi:MAG TPA: ABC transporter substrate-binding protein [Burkholderiales bacterium]|nr:ABC transporter substrate-binding protein [Burkholderiales bacterium]